jgi:hypothetical protein
LSQDFIDRVQDLIGIKRLDQVGVCSLVEAALPKLGLLHAREHDHRYVTKETAITYLTQKLKAIQTRHIYIYDDEIRQIALIEPGHSGQAIFFGNYPILLAEKRRQKHPNVFIIIYCQYTRRCAFFR